MRPALVSGQAPGRRDDLLKLVRRQALDVLLLEDPRCVAGSRWIWRSADDRSDRLRCAPRRPGIRFDKDRTVPLTLPHLTYADGQASSCLNRASGRIVLAKRSLIRSSR